MAVTATVQRFRQLGLNGKTVFLKQNGTYLGRRRFSTFDVHLYGCHGFYAEVWTRSISGCLCWIEIADEKTVADNYLGNVDVKGALGL